MSSAALEIAHVVIEHGNRPRASRVILTERSTSATEPTMYLMFLACTTPTAECRAGFEAGSDGLCYQEDLPVEETDTDTDADTDSDTDTDTDQPTVDALLDALLDALPACEPVATDGRIDLYDGCVDGVCPPVGYDDAVEDLGEPDCYGFYYEVDGYVGGMISCEWRLGIELDFDDVDQDGVADPLATAHAIGLNASFDGGTESGLGIGANMGCFVEELGAPDSVTFDAVDGEWLPAYAYWRAYGVAVTDSYGPGDSYEADGVVDGIRLYGSTVEL